MSAAAGNAAGLEWWTVTVASAAQLVIALAGVGASVRKLAENPGVSPADTHARAERGVRA
ncbi:hypothetical protein [Mycolicibacterium elephantis]|uniref:hypothetical protein n=1 Tax=Mycolicibacterium elephantis TaxID=81858 RepID=UPI001969BD54|nr:hypothetical protein [Mycolicibacterium elephantis]